MRASSNLSKCAAGCASSAVALSSGAPGSMPLLSLLLSELPLSSCATLSFDFDWLRFARSPSAASCCARRRTPPPTVVALALLLTDDARATSPESDTASSHESCDSELDDIVDTFRTLLTLALALLSCENSNAHSRTPRAHKDRARAPRKRAASDEPADVDRVRCSKQSGESRMEANGQMFGHHFACRCVGAQTQCAFVSRLARQLRDSRLPMAAAVSVVASAVAMTVVRSGGADDHSGGDGGVTAVAVATLQIGWLTCLCVARTHTHTRTYAHTHTCTHTHALTTLTRSHNAHTLTRTPTRSHASHRQIEFKRVVAVEATRRRANVDRVSAHCQV